MSDNVYQIDSRRRGSNDGGDNMLGNLEKRVEKLENQIGEIKTDLAKLTVRSENFATKADLIECNGSYKADVQTMRTEMHQAIAGIHKEISTQTKWIAATLVGVAAICMTAAKLLF
ncbi:TPA: hypothetical protein ACXLW9_000337 [Yersinia enterocolitica]